MYNQDRENSVVSSIVIHHKLHVSSSVNTAESYYNVQLYKGVQCFNLGPAFNLNAEKN